MNIAEPLFRHCVTRPDAVAIQSPTGRRERFSRAYVSVTFGDLQRRIGKLTAALRDLGISRGCRCALMVPPSIEFVELTFALFAAGAVPVFIDPGIGLKNLKACLAQAEPAAFIGITKAHIARLMFGWARASLRTLVTVGPNFGWGGVTLNRLRQVSAGSQGIVPTQAHDIAAILFTSGSTGVPKGAVYTHGMFVAQLEKLQSTFDIQPGEVDLCTFPLFALFGPALGMTSVIPMMDPTQPARVDVHEILQPVRRFAATNLFGSPALLDRVGRGLDSPVNTSGLGGASIAETEADVSMPSLKRVLSAGAPVSPQILKQFRPRLRPDVQIYTPYGATEALPVAVIGSEEVLNDTQHQTARGAGTCIGRAVAGLDVRVIRISDEPVDTWSEELVLPTGEIGEIVVNGPQVTQEYFRRSDLTALSKIPDPTRGRRWHRMGDVGYFDEPGRLWFCGRKSQRVITPARTLFTDQVEGVFNAHPAVFRSALVGVRRSDVLTPVLCVELEKTSKPPAKDAIERELLVLGARNNVTCDVRTILFHPRFPVDIRHNSKIFREKLAVWAARRLS